MLFNSPDTDEIRSALDRITEATSNLSDALDALEELQQSGEADYDNVLEPDTYAIAALDEMAGALADLYELRGDGRRIEVTTTASASDSTEHPGILAISRVLEGMRSANQGGYVNRKSDNSGWSFHAADLGPFHADEIDALFDLTGLEPTPITPLGACATCAHAANGRERGYASAKCALCARPRMSNYVLKASEGSNG
jgi:hypothetical protein